MPKQPNNLGGIVKVWALPSQPISIPNQSSAPDTYLLPVGFEEGAIELIPIYQSGKFSESVKPSPSGMFYEPVISLNLAKDSGALWQHLGGMANRSWVILSLDQNRQYRLTGSSAYPLRLSITRNTGSEISDLNHIHLEFIGPSEYPSVFIQNPF